MSEQALPPVVVFLDGGTSIFGIKIGMDVNSVGQAW